MNTQYEVQLYKEGQGYTNTYLVNKKDCTVGLYINATTPEMAIEKYKNFMGPVGSWGDCSYI